MLYLASPEEQEKMRGQTLVVLIISHFSQCSTSLHQRNTKKRGQTLAISGNAAIISSVLGLFAKTPIRTGKKTQLKLRKIDFFGTAY